MGVLDARLSNLPVGLAGMEESGRPPAPVGKGFGRKPGGDMVEIVGLDWSYGWGED